MIVAFGLNHKTASLDLRGKLSFAPEIVEKVLHDACTILHVREIVLLSTCNRTEVYLFGNVSDHQIVTWLAMIKGTEINALSECFYSLRNDRLSVGHNLVKLSNQKIYSVNLRFWS